IALTQVLVEARESHRRSADEAAGRAQRVPGHRSERRRGGPTSDDVAHDRHPTGGGWKDVVEVASHFSLAGGRQIEAAEAPTGDVRKVGRQEAPLQRGRDVLELVVEPDVLDCGRGATPKLERKLDIPGGQPPPRLRRR